MRLVVCIFFSTAMRYLHSIPCLSIIGIITPPLLAPHHIDKKRKPPFPSKSPKAN